MYKDVGPVAPPGRTEAPWTPYKIPATPNVTGDEVYALSCENGAIETKNPSQFLRWKRAVPKGEEKTDTLYWEPSVQPEGAWKIVDAAQGATSQRPKFLANTGSELEWIYALPDGVKKGDLLYWDPSVPPQGAWAVLEAVESEMLHVLTIKDGQLAWTETEDCE